MCLCFYYLNNDFFFSYPTAWLCLYYLRNVFMFFIPVSWLCFITSGMFVFITPVAWLCLYYFSNVFVFITPVAWTCFCYPTNVLMFFTPVAWLWLYYLSNVFVFVKPVTWLCFSYLRNLCFLPQLRDCVCVLLQLPNYVLLPQSSICALIDPLICVPVDPTIYILPITPVMYHKQGHGKEHKPHGWIKCTVFLLKEDLKRCSKMIRLEYKFSLLYLEV